MGCEIQAGLPDKLFGVCFGRKTEMDYFMTGICR